MIDLKAKPFYLTDADIAWVEATKKSMTEEEKLEQLFFPLAEATDEDTLQALLQHNPGGVLFRPQKSEALACANAYLQSNSKIPMLIAANLENGGNGAISDGTFFANPMQVAAAEDPKLQAYRLALVSCREAKAVGCNYTFAPVADIDMNYHNPITNVRTFGSDSQTVEACTCAYVEAARKCGMATAAKHFPGDGVDEVDQHILTSVNSLSCDAWDETYGRVYQSLIDADTLSIMAGHIAMPAYQRKLNPNHPNKLVPATLSPELLGGLLRGKLGFNGMIITDSSRMLGFHSAMDRAEAVPFCIEAGCDMLLFNKDYDEDLAFMAKGLERGILSRHRLEEAVTRILAMKAAIGLHKEKETFAAEQADYREHKQWAIECADEAATLVKDTQKLLPICPDKHRSVLLGVTENRNQWERLTSRYARKLEAAGFLVTVWIPDMMNKAETVEQWRKQYDLVIWVGNIAPQSNKTTNRLNWTMPVDVGMNAPWFTEVIPTVFVSMQNSYHLLDVPMVKTYVNTYSDHDVMIDAVVDKLVGRSAFKGKAPVDPFCGKEYLKW